MKFSMLYLSGAVNLLLALLSALQITSAAIKFKSHDTINLGSPEPFRAYNVSLPIYPVAYNDSQKADQLAAGTALFMDLDNFCSRLISQGNFQGPTTYTVAPGVYRLTRALSLNGVINVKLVLTNVELIATTDSWINIVNCDKIEVAGPVALEVDPLPTTQHIIVGTDLQSYIDVQPMPGYRPPNTGARVMFFTPDGRMQRHFQNGVRSATLLGNNTYRVTLDYLAPANSVEAYWLQKAVAVGNLFSTEGNGSYNGGGFYFSNSGDIFLHDLGVYGPGLIGYNGIFGTMRLDRFFGQRRPGTNRLTAGGFPLGSFTGGSFDMTNSEISYNYDDLTDMESQFGNAIAGPQPNQLYLMGYTPITGQRYNFYDSSSGKWLNEGLGDNRIVAFVNGSIDSDTEAALVAKAQARHFGTSPYYVLVNFSIPISGGSGVYIADNLDTKAKSMSIRNSYLHDSLASGIQLRGAHQHIVTGNIVARTALNCIASGYSPSYNEGGVPENVFIDNNTCIDVPYGIRAQGPAIGIFAEEPVNAATTFTRTIRNVTISNNVMLNPQSGGILVDITGGVKVVNNVISNLASTATFVRDNYKPLYGVSIQSSEKVVVQKNSFINGTAGAAGPFLAGPFLPDQVLVTNMGSARLTMQFSGNIVNGQPIGGPNYGTTPLY